MAKAKSEIEGFAADVAQQIMANRRNVLSQAETIMRAALEEHRPLDYSEIDFLQSEAGFDRVKINEETRRINRVITLQMQAGTSADREALAKQASAAQAELKTRGPELDQQIAQLQAERNTLEKNAAALTRRQDEVNQALEGLTKSVPPAVAAANNAKRGAIKGTIGRELSEQKIDLQHVQVILAGPSSPRDSNYWRSLQQFDAELVNEGLDGREVTFGYSSKWPTVSAQLKSELPKQEAIIAELEVRLADELAAIQADLQQYWR